MKKPNDPHQDLSDVYRAEVSRGRKPYDAEQHRLQRAMREDYLAALRGPLEDFRYVISALHEELKRVRRSMRL